jgi:hypothetical protein
MTFVSFMRLCAVLVGVLLETPLPTPRLPKERPRPAASWLVDSRWYALRIAAAGW